MSCKDSSEAIPLRKDRGLEFNEVLKLIFIEKNTCGVDLAIILVVVTADSVESLVFQGKSEWINAFVTTGAILRPR